IKKYRFQGVPFSAWLYRIAVNEVNQFFRQNKHYRCISLESTQLAAFMDEVEEVKGEGDMQRLVEVLRTLSDEEVQFIEMRYFERIPFKEVAAIYNITENNAKVRMYRLLAKLRKRMQQSTVEA
ncbi:MAG: sigma-70 family RNA polymerase sigma factor, partial [Bacteroidota bacterium]